MTEEIRKNHVVVTFGRANPPHRGHHKLFKTIRQHAESIGADHMVYLSHSKDKKTNPLSHADKVSMIHAADPHVHVHTGEVNTPIDMMKHVAKHYKGATVVVGSDRQKEMHNLLHRYNGKEYHLDHIEVKALDRDPGAKGTKGSSSTKMRHAAKTGNFKEFSKHVENKNTAKDMYMATRKGLGEAHRALFVLGGPGSGKDRILRETALREVHELPFAKLHDAIITQKDLTEVDGRALIVNGNADDVAKVILCKRVLEALDYQTGLCFIAVSDSISKERNEMRKIGGKKTITEEVRSERHAQVMRNLPALKEAFNTLFMFDNSGTDVDLSDLEAQAAVFFVGENLDQKVEQFLTESWGHKVGSFAKFKEHAEEHAFTNANIGGIKYHTREVGHEIGGNVKPWTQTSAILTYHHNQTQPYIIGTFNHHGPGASEEGHGQTLGYGKSMHEARDSEYSAHRALQDTAKMKAQGRLGGGTDYFQHVAANKEKQKATTQTHRTSTGSSYFNHVTQSQAGVHSTLAKKDRSPPIRGVPSSVAVGPTKAGKNQSGSTVEETQVAEDGNLMGFKAFRKNKVKPSPGSKGAVQGGSRFDSRVTDGMAMTATLAAEGIMPKATRHLASEKAHFATLSADDLHREIRDRVAKRKFGHTQGSVPSWDVQHEAKKIAKSHGEDENHYWNKIGHNYAIIPGRNVREEVKKSPEELFKEQYE